MRENGASDFIKVNRLLCRIDTFLFLISKISDWSLTDLFQEISSTTKLKG